MVIELIHLSSVLKKAGHWCVEGSLMAREKPHVG